MFNLFSAKEIPASLGGPAAPLIPSKLSGPDLTPEAENRGGAVGFEVITLDFTGSPTAKPVRFWNQVHYGFAMLEASDPALTGLQFFASRPRSGVTGVNYKAGMQFLSTSDKPVGTELWYQKASAQAMTVKVAVFLRPCRGEDVVKKRELGEPVSWTDQAQVTVNAADTSVIAANPNRRALSLFNASSGGQRIAVGVGTMTAVTRGIVFLDPGQGVILGPSDMPPVGAIRAYASAAGGLLNAAEGN